MKNITLWRPVGPKELELIVSSNMKAFPPRLPEQPIFYPVTTREYAIKITKDWNVPAMGSGYVTEFDVEEAYLSNYSIETAGGNAHQEYWIPAEEMDAFNNAINGDIRIVDSFSSDD